MSVIEERALVSQLRTGKRQAVERWFRAYSPYLLRIAKRRLPGGEDAEEIVQETFMNCLKQFSLFRGQSRLRTWMVSILNHEIADYYRKQYAKRALKIIPLADLVLARPVKNASETSEKVRLALSQMTREKKELLLMKYVDKKQVVEIARQLKKTVKSIESELFRARREFRALYLKVEEAG